MSRRVALGFLAVVVAVRPPALGAAEGDLPRGDARAEGFAPDRLERIRGLLPEAVDRRQIAGASALVVQLYPSDHLKIRERFKRLTDEALSDGSAFPGRPAMGIRLLSFEEGPG